MVRSALCLVLLCGFASADVVARESRLQGPGSGRGNAQQCADEEIESAVVEATQKSSTGKPRAMVTPPARKPAKATPSARGDGDSDSRMPAPRWHSFLPGMFR
jgi:hypothetical protein